jgi:hypothetical protein
LRDRTASCEVRVVGVAGGSVTLLRLELDEAIRCELVQLLTEMQQQAFNVLVDRLEVPQRLELVLERPQTPEVVPVGVPSADFRILEIGEDEGLVGGLELLEGVFELFLGVLADFGPEQHHEDVALCNGLVVLVLQARLRHGVEEVLPDHGFQEHAFADPFLVLATDEDFELVPVLFQFGGGGEE